MSEPAAVQETVERLKRKRLIGILFVIAAMIIFGSTFALNKYVMNQEVDPILFAFMRAVIAGVVIFPFFYIEPNKEPIPRNVWLLLIFVGAGAAALAQILEYTGTRYTTASNVSLIVSNEAVVAMLLSVWLLHEPLRKNTVIGAILSFSGMALVLLDDIRSLELHTGNAMIGDLIVLFSVIGWSLYTVLGKKIVQHCSPIKALFFITIFSLFTLGAASLMRGSFPQVMHIQFDAWWAIFYLGAMGSGLGHVLYFQALKRLPATLVSVSLTLLPVCGVGFSMILLGERLSWTQLLGGAIIIFGVGYAVWPREQKLIAA